MVPIHLVSGCAGSTAGVVACAATGAGEATPTAGAVDTCGWDAGGVDAGVSDFPEQPTTTDPDPMASTVIHARKVIPVSEEQFRFQSVTHSSQQAHDCWPR